MILHTPTDVVDVGLGLYGLLDSVLGFVDEHVEPEGQVGGLDEHQTVPYGAPVEEGGPSEHHAEHGLGAEVEDSGGVETGADGMLRDGTAQLVVVSAVVELDEVEEIQDASERVEDDNATEGQSVLHAVWFVPPPQQPILETVEADHDDHPWDHEDQQGHLRAQLCDLHLSHRWCH